MTVLVWTRRVAAALSLLFLVALVTSGWALMAGYVPSDSEAFLSVLYLHQQGGIGEMLRSLHHYLASGLVVAGFLYFAAAYLGGAHREDRHGWWLGLTAYLIVLGICFTGYLLPMDQSAYWGTVVRLGIVETVPLAGPAVADLLRGGATHNAATLPRFYTLHTSILPFLVLLCLAPLAAPALGRAIDRRRLAALSAALVAIYLLALFLRAPLGAPADPADTEFVPRPEWYFMWLFQLGKYLEAVPWVQSLLLPLVGLGTLYLLPAIRQSGATRWTLLLAWVGVFSLFTGLAYWQDRDLPPRQSYEEVMEARSIEWYEELCLECHGKTGAGDGSESRFMGYDTPDLTRAATWEEMSEIDMIRAIRSGKGDDMPAFGRRLTELDAVVLIDHLRRTFLEGSAVQVKEKNER